MFIDRIKQIKEYQFSITFQSWISTLLFLPLAVYFRFIIGTSLILDKDYTAYSRTVWILSALLLLWFTCKWLTANHLIITGLEKYAAIFLVAACVYNRLISLNPTSDEAQSRVDSLPCANEFDVNVCFIDQIKKSLALSLLN